ncbi:type II toxin-antitoxin system RelE/ParE family toxin [Candidatus Acetothermia bacterium]|nr:type II toxin-antitoxin system RelE/ParE family toxin [Candidatus Acetothermia bacterium]
MLSRAAAKDLDQLPLRLLDQLKSKHFLALAIDPRGAGRPKKGQLAGLYGYEFGPRGGYRLLYDVLDEKRLVLIIAIGPHDQAYRRATRRR